MRLTYPKLSDSTFWTPLYDLIYLLMISDIISSVISLPTSILSSSVCSAIISLDELNRESQGGEGEPAKDDVEERLHLLQTEGLKPPAVRVDNLGDGVAIARVGHKVVDPGVDEAELVERI